MNPFSLARLNETFFLPITFFALQQSPFAGSIAIDDEHTKDDANVNSQLDAVANRARPFRANQNCVLSFSKRVVVVVSLVFLTSDLARALYRVSNENVKIIISAGRIQFDELVNREVGNENGGALKRTGAGSRVWRSKALIHLSARATHNRNQSTMSFQLRFLNECTKAFEFFELGAEN